MKVALWYKDQLIAREQTEVKKNTLEPIFEKVFYFDLPELDHDGLKNVKLDLAVMDMDVGKKDDLMGRLVIGGEHCVTTGFQHWKKVMDSPLENIEMWHPLSGLGAVTTMLTIKSQADESSKTDFNKTQPSDQVCTMQGTYCICRQNFPLL